MEPCIQRRLHLCAACVSGSLAIFFSIKEIRCGLCGMFLDEVSKMTQDPRKQRSCFQGNGELGGLLIAVFLLC